jgi:hypothetical protein
MLGGSIGSSDTLKKISNLSFIDGTLMTSLSGMVTCIFANAPLESRFKSTLSVLGEFLGRSCWFSSYKI